MGRRIKRSIHMDRTKALAIVVAAACWCWPASCAPANAPEAFARPEQAVDALLAASRSNEPAALLAIFGPAGQDLVTSGDAIADREARARFIERYSRDEHIVRNSPDRATLVIGAEQWPFPIPIVRENGVWHFDAAAGRQEILNRRIGRNELNAMEVCREYVRAQRDYGADAEAEKLPAQYAQKFISSPGRHDGLYWSAPPAGKQSPIGPQMARARAEGYGESEANGGPAPYHGYYYRILTRQGPAAPGGARNYVRGGRMTGGFALIAFPAKYRS